MNRATQERTARTEMLVTRTMMVGGLLLAGFLLYAGVVAFGTPREGPQVDDTLPNPMGGPTSAAPGEATTDIELAGLSIAGSDVQMGDVALDVTYVPEWEIANPSDAEISFVVGQPQVLEGCCPGPIYADGELTQAGQEFTVAAGDRLVLQFPLQMHAGMDGPHHLAVPLASGGEQAAVHVSGNFTASAQG